LAARNKFEAIATFGSISAAGRDYVSTQPVAVELFSGLSLAKNGNIFSKGRRFSADNIQESTGVVSRGGRSVAKALLLAGLFVGHSGIPKLPDWMAGDAVLRNQISSEICC
jgi:hypothetical protein